MDLLAKILMDLSLFYQTLSFYFTIVLIATLILHCYSVIIKWWHNDITTTDGIKLETTTTIYGLQQLIDEPTHICKNNSSCIDLIFTNQSNLIVNRGTHPSLHGNCRHQITFAKARLRVEYLSPDKHHVQNFTKANVNGINILYQFTNK